MAEKELQLRNKQELQTDREQTRPGPVYLPAVDIFESEDAITLLADMPGVSSDHVSIDLHEGQLTIAGEVEDQRGEQEQILLQEYETGRFHRDFTLSDRIDQAKISATMKDGTLRLVLPKAEKAKPRKIPVTTA
ncbi:MAG: Hsp20/alpha crystallin family protein [Syntrophobacteria bacterium]